jgi:hypothetical protein
MAAATQRLDLQRLRCPSGATTLCERARRRTQAVRRPVPKGSPAMTSVSSIRSRLISAVSPEPARLLAAAAAELADRWNSANYDLGDADAVTDIGCVRDALRSLAGLFDPDSDEPFRDLYDWACELAEGQLVSGHAATLAAEADAAVARAASELDRALDRTNRGHGW